MPAIHMPEHDATEYQVWAVSPDGTPVYVYQTGLTSLDMAKDLAAKWNERPGQTDVPNGWSHIVVEVTTRYSVVRD